MAIMIVLVVLTIVGTLSDGLVAQPNFGFGGLLLPEVQYIPALPVPQPRAIPGFPQINLPQPPPIPIFTFRNPYEGNENKESFEYNNFKPYTPFYNFPTMETIKNTVPDPKGSYHALYVVATSNSNGEGVSDVMMEFIKHKIPRMKPHDFGSLPTFEIPVIKPMKFEPMDIDKIRKRVPASGEHFEMKSHNTHYSYCNDNGKVTSEGGVSDIHNNNGDVREKVGLFKRVP